ncbi:SDR family NAD(P)-dependent oxidoreductase [Psychrobacter sp.]|uniref:SDR family NAD(P)-dependent oxidoreductase n=1 Tax=Psychrobacter sp. TaxID=56811 RepID=UPI00264854EA|nr:SDR family NAD(P)-dependent oxidoreductase [Psychrobacter sp.]MDN6274977.1 SDR family NAD(P)-dependent oxidoreductase [Psychrobacter sp.]MDN6306998.1 SDR family NAD(P)-dependent oxidoreductase [Psychrobacter sp.]
MKTKYKNLTIWITGASSGIGQALAITFAKKGAKIILSGRNTEKLEAVRHSCKNKKKHIIVPFDISDAEQAKEAYETAKAEAGKIDWLINNAGISQRSLIMETEEAVERQLMKIDYFAQTRLTRLVLPDMIAQGGGKVVMISSVAGLLGTQYRGAYGAAKAAIHMWANSLRAELHHQGIEVATVFPGFIQTNVSINALTGDGTTQGTMDEATDNGLSANTFAKRTVKALSNGEEYIIVAGTKEMLATRINRLSPPKLYSLIRNLQVK